MKVGGLTGGGVNWLVVVVGVGWLAGWLVVVGLIG